HPYRPLRHARRSRLRRSHARRERLHHRADHSRERRLVHDVAVLADQYRTRKDRAVSWGGGPLALLAAASVAGERRRFLGDSFASALDGGARKLYPRRAVIRSFCEWLFSSIDTTLRSAGWCESSIFEKLNAIP